MTKWPTVSLIWFAFTVSASAQATLRVGAFPDITHAQAMVGKANGWFDKAMGPQVKVQWSSFNAGPSAIEALFAGAIDMTYVGSQPSMAMFALMVRHFASSRERPVEELLLSSATMPGSTSPRISTASAWRRPNSAIRRTSHCATGSRIMA